MINRIISCTVLLFSLMVACNNAKDQSTESKQQKTFKSFADEDGFSEKHDEPKAMVIEPLGEMKKVQISGSKEANIYSVEHDESSNYLIVLHEWWGLNDYIIRESDRLFTELGDVNVIAIDLYDGKVAQSREKASEYMKGANEQRLVSIITGVLNSLPSNAHIASVGWCFGGGWSLKTSIIAKEKSVACVMYYGMPIDEVEKLKQLQAPVLFIYGKRDQWIDDEVANQFVKNMDLANQSLEVLAFDEDHAFANPTSDKYDEAAASKANQAAINFIANHLK